MISRNIYAAHDYALRDLYKESLPKDVLQDTTMASMTGVLHQLGFLATYSAQIFDGIYEIAKQTDSRLKRITTKLTTLQREVPTLEKMFAGGSPTDFKENSEQACRRDYIVSSQLFTKETRPAHVKIQYDSINQPPRVSLLDPYQPEGTEPCLCKYSDPEFFFREWLREENAKLAKIKEAKRARRAQRRKRKKQSKRINVQRLDVRNYEVDGNTPTNQSNAGALFETANAEDAERLRAVDGPSQTRQNEQTETLAPVRAAPSRPDKPSRVTPPAPVAAPARTAPSRPEPSRSPPAVMADPASSPRRNVPQPSTHIETPSPNITEPVVAKSSGPVVGPGECIAKEHPLYSKYFMQLSKGLLPRMAIERNMIMLQLSTSILDTPNQVISIDNPPMATPVKKVVKKKAIAKKNGSAPKKKAMTLQEQLAGFDRSKLAKAKIVKSKKLSGRDSILDQIKKGMILKDSKKRKLKAKKAPEKGSREGMNNDIAAVLKERYAVLHGQGSESEDSWASEDEDDW